MGLSRYVWDHEDDILDELLKPIGITFDEFRRIGTITGRKVYRRHEEGGFDTASKKVELYSESLKKWGFDPMPVYIEPPETPYSAPDMIDEYPLIFTSLKLNEYWHSCHRQLKSLREAAPDPIVRIHPETAHNLGIKDGDDAYIETKRGKIKQKAVLTDIVDKRVVLVDFGWWFPEKGAENQHGWEESNYNILTDNKPPYNKEMGSLCIRGLLCKVFKA